MARTDLSTASGDAHVFLVGDEPRIVVPVARHLHAHGIVVHVFGFGSGRNPRSRAIRSFNDTRPDRLAGALGDAAEHFAPGLSPAALVMPAGDTALACVAALPRDSARLLPLCPPPDVVARVLNKETTLEVARTVGIEVPTTISLAPGDDLGRVARPLHFPVIAKAGDKASAGGYPFKTFYAETFADLERGVGTVAAPLLVQEDRPGYGRGLEILLQEGRPIATFQHRRVLESPPDGGVSVLAVSEPVDDGLREEAIRLLRALGWDGLAMVEFRSNDEGRHVLMEVNGRLWGSIALALHAGVNFPLYQYQLALGRQPVPPATYPAGLRCRWFVGDLTRLAALARAGRATPRDVVRVVRDLAPDTRSMLWDRRDAAPAFIEAASYVRELAARNVRRTLVRLAPASLRAYRRYAVNLDRPARAVLRRVLLRHVLGLKRPPAVGLHRGPRRIVFLCHGNIMRSAFAAALLDSSLGWSAACEVRSAGLKAKPGRPADKRMIVVARDYGVDLATHRARAVEEADLAAATDIYVMDYVNEAIVEDRFPHVASKVRLLTEALPVAPRFAMREIADPYDGTIADVRDVAARIASCVRAIETQLAATQLPAAGDALADAR